MTRRPNQFRRSKAAEDVGADTPAGRTEAADRPADSAEAIRTEGAPAKTLTEQRLDIIAARAAAEDEIKRLELFEQESILDASDAELDEAAEEIVRLKRKITRLELMEKRLAEQIKVAEADGREAKRVERYAAARDLVAEAETWITGEYAAHAAAIRAGLIRLGEIHDQLRTANDDLPDGQPMLDAEAFRILPGKRGTSRTVDEVYYVDTEGTVLAPSEEQKLRQDATGQYWVGTVAVFARSRQNVVSEPGRPAAAPQPLLASVRLPRVLYADEDFWNANSRHWSG